MLTIVISSGFLFGSFAIVGNAGDKTLKQLKGQWMIYFARMSDKIVPLEKLGMDRLIIKKDKLSFQNGDKVLKTYGLKLIPGHNPPAINWIRSDGAKALPCIYQLSDGELHMCFPLLASKDAKVKISIERPKDFDTDKKPFGMFKAKLVD